MGLNVPTSRFDFAARPLAGLRAQDPEAGAGADYHSLAESLDLDESAVDVALARLVLAKAGQRRNNIELSYRPPHRRRPSVGDGGA